MAHVGQEFTFGPGGRFRFKARRGLTGIETGVADGDGGLGDEALQ